MQGAPLQHMPTPHPWSSHSWSQFWAGEGCRQTSTEAHPWLFPDSPLGLWHSLLAFHPGQLLSILVLALQEGFGDRGVGTHFNCLGTGSYSFCGWRDPVELAARRLFSLLFVLLEQWNLEGSGTSAQHAAAILMAGQGGNLWAGALYITSPRLFWGRNMHLVESDILLGRGERGAVSSTGWDCAVKRPELLKAGRFPLWSVQAGINLPPTLPWPWKNESPKMNGSKGELKNKKRGGGNLKGKIKLKNPSPEPPSRGLGKR